MYLLLGCLWFYIFGDCVLGVLGLTKVVGCVVFVFLVCIFAGCVILLVLT